MQIGGFFCAIPFKSFKTAFHHSKHGIKTSVSISWVSVTNFAALIIKMR
jgi:hypothetical protein